MYDFLTPTNKEQIAISDFFRTLDKQIAAQSELAYRESAPMIKTKGVGVVVARLDYNFARTTRLRSLLCLLYEHPAGRVNGGSAGLAFPGIRSLAYSVECAVRECGR